MKAKSGRVLITGISGFVGSHLAEYVLKQGFEVYGIIRWRSKLDNIAHIKDKLKLIEGDIRDSYSMQKAIEEAEPDSVFHLAAQSFVPASWRAPSETVGTNVLGTLNVLEACRNSKLDPRILVVGSSEEYGMVFPDEIPIKETNPLRPLSPYAVSKVATDMLGYQYHQSYGLKIIRTRAFNHSVSKWTPVIIRDDESGIIDIRYISELRKRQKVGGYLSGEMIGDVQMWNLQRYPLSIWSDDGWEKLQTISCHPIRNNKLLKIVTRASIYDVTDNHSILDDKGNKKKAVTAKVGDKIRQYELPNGEIMSVPTDLSWLYGFFVAEGDMANGKFRISNKSKALLEKCKDILLKYFGKYSVIANEKNDVYRLYMRSPLKITKHLRAEFYASDKNKRVPSSILNSNKEVKQAFLNGFNDGDGLIKGYNSEDKFKSFKTKSPILAMGLCYLIENTTKQRYTLSVEQREGDRVYYSINLNSRYNNSLGKHLKKPQNMITKIIELPYDEEVWDFETKNNHFHCGIGKGIVHNTGPRRGEPFVTSNFAKQIAEIEAGLRKPVMYVGNFEAKRDFTDVRDVVVAYWKAVEHGEYGEVYNICSEVAWRIGDVLQTLLSMSEADTIKVECDPSRMRPSDVQTLLCDCAKFREKTGWTPTISFETTLRDLLDYWRAIV